MEEVKLTSLVRSSGCNAKLPPGDLHKALDGLGQQTPEPLIEGFESSDDALVYDLGDGRVLIETVDFFCTAGVVSVTILLIEEDTVTLVPIRLPNEAPKETL